MQDHDQPDGCILELSSMNGSQIIQLLCFYKKYLKNV